MNARLLFLISFLFFAGNSYCQLDSMKLTGNDQPLKEYVESPFKSTRVIMSHSIQMLKPGVLDFRILHRFGELNGGFYQAFGLDGPATIRLGLDYGLTKDLSVGIGHATYKKEIDGFLKYRIVQQSTGYHSTPFSLVLAGGLTMIRDTNYKRNFNSGLGSYVQLLVGRKFSEAFTLQLSPILIHRDSVYPGSTNNTFAIGTGFRLKISRRTSINADYYFVFNKDVLLSVAYNPLSIGFDIETGGHVFQLHFTNATGMNEREFITETRNRWSKGEVVFGFNISRSFQVKKRNI